MMVENNSNNSNIPILESNDIMLRLKARIKETNKLYNFFKEHSFKGFSSEERFKKDDKYIDVDFEKTTSFKYIFDLSTAIEATIRSIAFKMMNSMDKDNYIKHYTKPRDKGKGFFISLSELRTFVKINDKNRNKRIFDVHKFEKNLKIIEPLKNYIINFNKEYCSDGYFNGVYKKCMDNRNRLAHSLVIDDFDFTANMLVDYYYIFFSCFHI